MPVHWGVEKAIRSRWGGVRYWYDNFPKCSVRYIYFTTLKLKCIIKKKPITILVDSGNTHNFLDPNTARQAGCKIEPTKPLWVIVADGTKICSRAVCTIFCWVVHGQPFVAQVRILPLSGCDVVLGIEWLKNINPVEMDFRRLGMSFVHQGKKGVTLGGMGNTGELGFIITSGLQ